jgi:hypothetical protein
LIDTAYVLGLWPRLRPVPNNKGGKSIETAPPVNLEPTMSGGDIKRIFSSIKRLVIPDRNRLENNNTEAVKLLKYW